MSGELGDRYVEAGPPKNVTAIEARVRNLAKDAGLQVQRLRHSVAVAVCG